MKTLLHYSSDVLLTKQGYETEDTDFSEHQARKTGSVYFEI